MKNIVFINAYIIDDPKELRDEKSHYSLILSHKNLSNQSLASFTISVVIS